MRKRGRWKKSGRRRQRGRGRKTGGIRKRVKRAVCTPLALLLSERKQSCLCACSIVWAYEVLFGRTLLHGFFKTSRESKRGMPLWTVEGGGQRESKRCRKYHFPLNLEYATLNLYNNTLRNSSFSIWWNAGI